MIEVFIRNRQKVLFAGEASAVTAYSEKGVFDILPGHANFISIIMDKIIIHGKKREKQQLLIKSGVLKVQENKVFIFLDLLSPLPFET
ncbi:hypothetical protein ISS42_00040 [Candidatus Shapirobacteria bacterium]|nr:hypothetical protein [Candidatus Shapirobacteria bacterium]